MSHVKTTVKHRIIAADGSCAICNARDDLTVDHIIPRQLGGGSVQTNLITLCQPCNAAKGHRMPSPVERAWFAQLVGRRTPARMTP